MRRIVLIVPGTLETRTGGYIYDRRIVDGLCAHGWAVDIAELDGGFPTPSRPALDLAGGVLAAIPSGTTVLIDGLALGAMPEQAERERSRLRIVALVHHPLAAETGLDSGLAHALYVSERRALAASRLVIVTSRATRAALKTYDVSPDRIAVVEPGTDRAPVARGSAGATCEVLCVATLTPRKGHQVLFRALSTIPAGPWHVTCVGSLDRDPATVERLRAQIESKGLADRVALVGEAAGAALDEFYDRSDLFVLPTFYEGYGMAVAEALARGLPVVSTDTGAIGTLVTQESGVLVPSGDAQALAGALSRLMLDPSARGWLSAGAKRVRERLPTWADAAGRMAAALDRVASGELDG